ncbi:hypothetical protein ASPWEDRAFT_33353 [Aspergillus wentii DTO 134E9]|uniref:BZIP domain-containing protein n=1 Tax=Aspergillus wentii DTO 134E9 TaxID=1073089 RepID=A0A1L9RYH1_ASPWE|nr:uncharacterized protein ASPWEDRAFT_33353 [Aspergillus wentii DTO 134E9]KAI9932443.1 hypothetical protein MW887_008684 [Aspergillus wentii]OJJ40010.1 hypothetical protein ASPWEDRAFT_33353 [Aspergillus wentii DTO 134E9]
MSCIQPSLTTLTEEPSMDTNVNYADPLYAVPATVAANIASNDLGLSILNDRNFFESDSMSAMLNWDSNQKPATPSPDVVNEAPISPRSQNHMLDSAVTREDLPKSGIEDTRPSLSWHQYSKTNKNTPKRNHSNSSQSNDDDEKTKREKYLERNRVAANKCRQKKKQQRNSLEARLKTQSESNQKLVAEIGSMRSIILTLKNEVLEHSQCNDERLKHYVSFMERSIANTVPAGQRSRSESSTSSSKSRETSNAGIPQGLLPLSDSTFLRSAGDEYRRDSKDSMVSEVSWASSMDDDLMNMVKL